MIRHTANGIVFYQFASLIPYGEVLHAVFTRIGGTSRGAFRGLNVGHLVGDDAATVDANHALIFQTLGIRAETVVTARQVHGANVAIVGKAHWGSIMPATDSLVSIEEGTVLLLRFADCVPLMLYDPFRHALGLVHVGWRGLFAGVVLHTLSALQQALRCHPRDIVAGIGPAIGPCCYEVGHDVVERVKQTFGADSNLLQLQPHGAIHFDLPGAVRYQLHSQGVQHIEDSGLCTSCHTNEFFSHRAEHGHTGRFAAVLGLGH